MKRIRNWRGRWISSGKRLSQLLRTTDSAPIIRKTFHLDSAAGSAKLYLCALGLHVLYINGVKADDRVLAPAVSRYDKRCNYITYDVTHLLRKGLNTIAVILGNGLFNCFETSHWGFDTAPWRDWPKLCCDLEVDGKIVLASDNSWKLHDSPITFDAWRSGEHYDARRFMPDFALPELDDSAWQNVCYCTPPGGVVEEENMPPCRITKTFKPVAIHRIYADITTYDFGINLTGFAKIKVRGNSGSTLILQYGEKVDQPSNRLNTRILDHWMTSGAFQCDRYTLRGDENGEEWMPSFTYHGFRYIQAVAPADVEILEIEACFVHTDFQSAGSFESSSDMLNTLQRNTRQSYLSNFTGIPTDCPHREKNGWTGDASLAMETGVWNFDVREACCHFLDTLTACQRDNGQLPAMAPTGSFGYNWGNGPLFDSVIFEYCYQIYLFYGDSEPIRRYYEPMKRYLDYCQSMAPDFLAQFGLGDWKPPADITLTDPAVVTTAFYHLNVLKMSFFADLLGKTADADHYKTLAENIADAFRKNYPAPDTMTALACALHSKIITGKDAADTAAKLAELCRKNQHKALFGIAGAKCIPRALAENGYASDAYKIITQTEYPGWGWQVRQGATSLWEAWHGGESQNHIMYGDISAWMYQYLGGIKPQLETPGFKHCRIEPIFIDELDFVKMSHQSPNGVWKSSWQRKGNMVECIFELPLNCTAQVVLPGVNEIISAGVNKFTISGK